MRWSSGSNPDKTREVTKLDVREQYMTFDYEVRTSDNVRLRLEGTVFWRIVNVPKMVHATPDPAGDVWHHTRSTLIQAVSQVSLEKFMQGFNGIVMKAFESEAADSFYHDRGVAVESMEVSTDCRSRKVRTMWLQPS